MADDEPADDEAEQSAPLGDLAERVRSRRTGRGSAADEPASDEEFELEDYFQEVTYPTIGSDELWATIDGEPGLGPGGDLRDEPAEHVVSKRSYCEGCQHFAEPPEVYCTHPGTTIVEFVDTDHVRVRNCPIVAERRAMGEEDEESMTPSSFGDQ